MKTESSLRERLKHPASRTLAREELRRRILEILNRGKKMSDGAIWHASAPDYLPWDFMLAEIKTLHADGRLRLEIVAPGQWVIHSIATTKSKEARRRKGAADESQAGEGIPD